MQYNTDDFNLMESLIRSDAWKRLKELYEKEKSELGIQIVNSYGKEDEETKNLIFLSKAISDIIDKPNKIIRIGKTEKIKKGMR